MNRPLRPLLAIVATAIIAHLALGFVVSRLQPRPEDARLTTHAEFESIAEEAMAIRVALEIDRMKVGYIDDPELHRQPGGAPPVHPRAPRRWPGGRLHG